MSLPRFSTLPLFCLFLAGCRTPVAPEQTAAPASDASAAPLAAPSAPVAAPSAPTSAKTPARTYRVKSDAENAAQGPEYAAAMKKVRLAPPPLSTKIADKTRVVFDTTRGPITLELDAKAAPLHVRSFLYLAGKGFFDGIKFHRHADLIGDGSGFIIQGGDPLTKSNATAGFAGGGGPGYEIPREFNALKHDKLVIAAARTADPDSASSQFYITQGPVYFLDRGDGYTVFGKVVSGADAALKLRADDTIKSVKINK